METLGRPADPPPPMQQLIPTKDGSHRSIHGPMEVHMIVQRTAHLDAVGLSGHPAFKFVRMLQHDGDVPLALDESADSVEDK